jgi:hypothetical protein
MAKRTFKASKSWTQKIADTNGIIGTIRVRPNAVLWKPKGAKGPRPWHLATIERFEKFMTNSNRKKVAK